MGQMIGWQGLVTAAVWTALIVVPIQKAPARQTASQRAPVQPSRSEEARLLKLFAEDNLRKDALDPMSVLYRGEQVSPQALSSLFTDEMDRRQLASAQQSLKALNSIRRYRLSEERQISYDIFRRDKLEQIAWLRPDIRALTAVRPLNHFSGLHVEFPSLMASDGAMRYASVADYHRAQALNRAFVTVLDNATAAFRRGIGSGITESQLTVRNMISQLDALLAQDIGTSPFTSPVRSFPPAVAETERVALRAAFIDDYNERIRPAYQRLRTFLADEYLPAARPTPGLSAMKGGDSLYRVLIARQTTLPLSPDDVHTLGLSEVARIQREMDGVRVKMQFSGNLREFFDFVRTNPRFHPRSKEELSDGFAAVARKVEEQTPRFFSRTPKTKLQVQPYPAYREKYEAGGSYNQGSADGNRPGIFYFNTYDLPARFLTGVTTLYLHEGAPGHHFQISLAQEDKSLPNFQRFDGNNAFVEGWALYAETLGYEMGLYDDPEQHWGTLDDEMLRAMRLVVDTGLHARGWSREQAIDYMLANSGMGKTDATAEVERYIANPAQALSYKIGALTIQRLRKKAEVALGAKFDLRAFHDQVLGSGAMPLGVLEAKIDRWINRAK